LQVFGEVAEGLDTLTRINEAYVDEKGRPYKNIRLILLPPLILF
jgi:peptidyl-prolyl cis-trans isomerase-like 4